jgi:hypothetical protein
MLFKWQYDAGNHSGANEQKGNIYCEPGTCKR